MLRGQQCKTLILGEIEGVGYRPLSFAVRFPAVLSQRAVSYRGREQCMLLTDHRGLILDTLSG
jgi:hypothetical protein